MRRIHLLLILAILPLSLSAQSEGGLWLGAGFDYGITKKWEASLEAGGRLEDNFSRTARYDAGFALSYKPLKWLRLGAGYTIVRSNSEQEAKLDYKRNDDGSIRYNSNGYPVVNGYNVDEAYWRTKHRAIFDVTAKWKVGRLGFSLRERYQYTHFMPADVYEAKYRKELEPDEVETFGAPVWGPYVDEEGDAYYYGLNAAKSGIDTKGAKDRHNLRSRLLVDYNIRRCPVTPFVSYELNNDLNDNFAIVRHRLQAGADINLDKQKQHALSVAYIYQHGAQDGVGNDDLHILSLAYKFSLDSPRLKAQKARDKKQKKNKL